MTEKTPLKVNCPTCQKEVTWHDKEKFRPFCSERCQQIDLGAWANEEYTIPVSETETWSESSLDDADSLIVKRLGSTLQ